MTILLYIAIGLAVGVVSGMMGIGGGIMLVPALVWLCGFDVRKAAGTTLAILVPPIGLPAAWRALQENRVDLQAALWIALSFACGAFIGVNVVKHVPENILRLLFAFFMIYVAVRLIFSTSSEAKVAAAALFAIGLSWISFLALRALGRRHLPRPEFHPRLQQMHGEGYGETDYHI